MGGEDFERLWLGMHFPSDSLADFPTGNVAFTINGAAGSPNIPDRALGWEVDAGFDWKLLEGFTTNFTLAYWAPGKWFNYACIDRSVPVWNVPEPPISSARVRTRPLILLWEVKLIWSFPSSLLSDLLLEERTSDLFSREPTSRDFKYAVSEPLNKGDACRSAPPHGSSALRISIH